MNKINISVVGAGYVGMSLSTMLAKDNNVFVLDTDAAKVSLINDKKSTVQDNSISKILIEGNLSIKATSNKKLCYKKADFILIAVPTDFDSNINEFDTSIVETVISDIRAINKKSLIIIKSTVPIGFTSNQCHKHNTEQIIFCPEFLREGQALFDNLNPSRLILGCKKSKAVEKFTNLINKATEKKDYPILYMSSSEAEAVKLFSNAYLAMRVSFFNELDTFSHTNSLDTFKIIEGISTDKRIGNYYNNPSFGYGGYCLPKDTKQLLSDFGETPQALFKAIINSNKIRKKYIANEIIKSKPRVIGVYRLIMKSNSDNYRNSAIKDIIKLLKEEDKSKIIIYEPLLKESQIQGCIIEKDLKIFKDKCDLILVNRGDNKLDDIDHKIFTRDIFRSD